MPSMIEGRHSLVFSKIKLFAICGANFNGDSIVFV